MTVTIATDERIAIVTIDNPPVNAASHAVRQGLMDAIARVDADDDLDAAVLICAGRTFVAGADVREFGKPPVAPHLPDVVIALEQATKPWVAAIHGTALGGGLELALGCAYRIAGSGAKMGLPEVNLGLIPGAGGTVRLTYLIGARAALDMMASGKPITAAKALELGLIDDLCPTDLPGSATGFARLIAQRAKPAPIPDRSLPETDTDALAAQIDRVKAKARGQNSPLAVCEAVQNAVGLSAHDALAAERALFLRQKEDPQSLALRHIFFAERAVGKITAIDGVALPTLQSIGVVGGGTMGAGIAAACLLAGLAVTMIERDEVALGQGQDRIAEILAGSVARGLLSATKREAILDAFTGATNYQALQHADLVIEAVFEDLDVKQTVFLAVAKVAKPDTILASNTSYLDVGQIAQVLDDPARVIGLHFFSPAHIMKLLELVIPPDAAPHTIATGVALGKRLRKITVPAGVCDGFIGNRIMSAYRRECDYMIEDGALPQQVDRAMRDFGFPMGIFEMQDLAGLDIAWAMRKRRAATRPTTERYVAIADELCEMGRLGRKTGQGWYVYEGKDRQIDPDVTALIEACSARKGITRRSFSDEEIIERILSVMQAEGRAILAEGIAAKPGDIDVVMVNGYAFPRWRGGPMYMAD